MASVFAKGDDFSCGLHGIVCYRLDSGEEEFDPAFPITIAPNGSEAIIVFRTVHLEVVREVEEGMMEDISLAKKEGDQESADAPIAIEKGVDGLELGVDEAAMDEGGELFRLVDEVLKLSECLVHLGDRGRDVGGGSEGAVGWTNPVLGAAEFAGVSVRATGAGEELFMDFGDEPEGERKVLLAKAG